MTKSRRRQIAFEEASIALLPPEAGMRSVAEFASL